MWIHPPGDQDETHWKLEVNGVNVKFRGGLLGIMDFVKNIHVKDKGLK